MQPQGSGQCTTLNSLAVSKVARAGVLPDGYINPRHHHFSNSITDHPSTRRLGFLLAISCQPWAPTYLGTTRSPGLIRSYHLDELPSVVRLSDPFTDQQPHLQHDDIL